MKPEEWLDPASFPDDLKWIPTHYRLHPDDPVYLLLAWHWRRVQQSEDGMKAAAVELKSMLDGRMSGVAQAVDAVARLEEELAEVQGALELKPAQWEAGMKEPLAGVLKEARAVEQVLAPIAGKFEVAQRRHMLMVFVVGVCFGVLGSLVLFLR